MASIIRRHPSSEIVATYFRSGENTKAAGKGSTHDHHLFKQSRRTNNALLGYLPVAYWILCSLLLLCFPASRDVGADRTRMPRRHCHENRIKGIPFSSGCGFHTTIWVRRWGIERGLGRWHGVWFVGHKYAIFSFFVINKNRSVCMRY